ncbi:hypothetical protein OG381_00070 [Streptomyces sp. NBC_00490]|uniref:hypothetical protein n=1 Tax=Streptomyces sp. NBC_00490 TaxID=2903657 RepID=UPI002E1814D6
MTSAPAFAWERLTASWPADGLFRRPLGGDDEQEVVGGPQIAGLPGGALGEQHRLARRGGEAALPQPHDWLKGSGWAM